MCPGCWEGSEQLGEDRQRECGHRQPSPEPVPLAGVGVAADGVVLVCQPHDEDDVESSCGVIEELRHYGLHTWGHRGHQYVAGHGKGFCVTSKQGCDCTCPGYAYGSSYSQECSACHIPRISCILQPRFWEVLLLFKLKLYKCNVATQCKSATSSRDRQSFGFWDFPTNCCFSRGPRRTMELTVPSNSRAFCLVTSSHSNHLPWPAGNRELDFPQIPEGRAASTSSEASPYRPEPG